MQLFEFTSRYGGVAYAVAVVPVNYAAANTSKSLSLQPAVNKVVVPVSLPAEGAAAEEMRQHYPGKCMVASFAYCVPSWPNSSWPPFGVVM